MTTGAFWRLASAAPRTPPSTREAPPRAPCTSSPPSARPARRPPVAVAVLSNQMVVAYRQGATRSYAGICRHELVPGGQAGFRIRLKRFDLVDSEGVHEGIAVIL